MSISTRSSFDSVQIEDHDDSSYNNSMNARRRAQAMMSSLGSALETPDPCHYKPADSATGAFGARYLGHGGGSFSVRFTSPAPTFGKKLKEIRAENKVGPGEYRAESSIGHQVRSESKNFLGHTFGVYGQVDASGKRISSLDEYRGRIPEPREQLPGPGHYMANAHSISHKLAKRMRKEHENKVMRAKKAYYKDWSRRNPFG